MHPTTPPREGATPRAEAPPPDHPLVFAPDATPTERQAVADGVLAHNAHRQGDPALEPVAWLVRGDDGRVLGGLLGKLWWRWLHVEKLWVGDELRGRGHGARLLDAAETYARSRGCVGAALDTIDPDARAFYERRGYAVFGVLDGFPPGGRQWFLRKALAAAE